MKKIISMLIAAVMLMQLSAFAQENDIHTDDCSNLKAVYERSDYWKEASTDKDAGPAEDSGRYVKLKESNDIEEAQYLTYYLKSIKAAEVTYYHYQSSGKEYITIKYSPDNKTWIDANPVKVQNPNKLDKWNVTKVTADNLPKGTKYIRIEVTNKVKYNVCAIGEVKLTEGERSEKNDPIGEPGDNAKLTESCDSLDGVFEKSEKWGVDRSNSANFGGDEGKFVRTSGFTNEEYLTFKVPGMISAEMNFYHMLKDEKEPWNKLKAEFSNDNENWTEVTLSPSAKGLSTAGGWLGKRLVAEAPGGSANYFRITVGDYGATAWVICFGEFEFTSRPSYEKIQGNLAKEGSKVKASFDIPINLSVYDSLTMVLVMQDENGVITGIEQYMFTPEENNVHMEAETEIAENTKTVSAYFWNSIWGMHKVADVQTINV